MFADSTIYLRIIYSSKNIEKHNTANHSSLELCSTSNLIVGKLDYQVF